MNRSSLAIGLALFSAGLSTVITGNFSRMTALMRNPALANTDEGQTGIILIGTLAMLIGSAIIAYAFPKKP